MAIFNLSKRTLVLLLSLSSSFLGVTAEPDDANNSPTYAPSTETTPLTTTETTTYAPTVSPTGFEDPCQNCKDLHAAVHGKNRCKRKCLADEEFPLDPVCDDKCCKKLCKAKHSDPVATCVTLGYCEDIPPTVAPTDSPTFSPTDLPTIAPTIGTSSLPTITPQPSTTTSTLEPTITSQPTRAATKRPTRKPYQWDDWD